jgi:hypothetical protein
VSDGKGNGETSRFALRASQDRRTFIVAGLLRRGILGTHEAARDGQLPAIIECDDGPCPCFLPVAEQKGGFGQIGDLLIERSGTLNLFVGEVVAFVQAVAFPLQLGESLGLFRGKRLALAAHLSELGERCEIGRVGQHFNP